MKNAGFITKNVEFITKNVESAGEKIFLRKKNAKKNDDPTTKMRFLAYGRRKSPLHRGFLDARAEPHLPTISFASRCTRCLSLLSTRCTTGVWELMHHFKNHEKCRMHQEKYRMHQEKYRIRKYKNIFVEEKY